MSGAQSRAGVSETACGLRVDGQADAEADEVFDPVSVAADEAKLSAELLLPATPSPPGAGGCGISRAKS